MENARAAGSPVQLTPAPHRSAPDQGVICKQRDGNDEPCPG